MKNILAENLLRFGVKNLNESQKQTLNLLMEEVLTGVKDGCAVVGATKSNTSNAGAVDAFITAGYKVAGTISSTTCIKKAAGGASNSYTVGPKTVNQAHYLKIGDKVISGTSPSSMIITFADLKAQAIEAAGNGIYALGRALKAKSSAAGFGLTMSAGLSITLNTSKVMLSMFNVNTGFQDIANRFGGDVIRQMIAYSILQPTGTGSSLIPPGMKRREFGNARNSEIFSGGARPSLADMTDAEKEAIKTVGSFDSSNDPDIGRKINNLSAAKPVVTAFCKRYFQPYVDSVAAKFKKYIELKCTAAGVPVDALATLNAIIDSYAKVQNISTYTDEALKAVGLIYTNVTVSPGSSVGARSTSTSIAGKEGSITGASGQK